MFPAVVAGKKVQKISEWLKIHSMVTHYTKYQIKFVYKYKIII